MKSKIFSLFSAALLFSCLFFPANKNYAGISQGSIQTNDSIIQQNDSIQIGDSVKRRVRKSSSYIIHYFGNGQRQNIVLKSQSRQIENFAGEIDTTKVLKMDSTNINK